MADKNENYVYYQETRYLAKVEKVLNNFIIKNDKKIHDNFDEMRNLDNSYEDFLSRQWYLDRIDRYKEENEEYYTMQNQPFFAHLEFADADKKHETFYVGKKSIYENGNPLVIDWRAKAAQAFYQKTSKSFTFDNKEYILRLRRAILINNAKIEDIETEYDITENDLFDADDIIDPFLLKVIREKRQIHKLTDIIVTIQSNQMDIIHKPINAEFIVQGCAGSGKTMILLHRLSYLKFHNPDIPLKKIKVLTPNNYFDLFIRELSSNLELNQIQRLSVENYYIDILVSKYKVLNKVEEVVPDDCLSTDMLQELYSYRFINECINRSKRYFANIKDNFRYNHFESLNHDNSSLQKIYSENRPSKFFNRISYYYESVKKEYGKKELEYKDAMKKCNECNKKIKDLNKGKLILEEQLYDIAEKKENVKLQMIKEDESITRPFMEKINSFRRKKGLKVDLKKIEKLETDVETDYKNKDVEIEQYKNIIKSLLPAIESRPSEQMYNALNRLGEFSLFNFEKYNSETINKYEKEVLLKFGFNNSKKIMYRYRLFLLILSAYCYYGAVIEADRWLNIDEAQDLSLSEYYVIKLVMGDKCRFNLYGDLNQLICQYKGIKDWNILNEIMDINLSTLNENFRNSLQIAEYCNDALNLNIVPIGVEGENVSVVDINYALSKILSLKKMDKNSRSVIICKSPEMIGAKFNNQEDKSYISIGEVDFSKVSIVSVNQVKGLEFDVVVVIEEAMERNEKYISYTRALDCLYIVKNSQ